MRCDGSIQTAAAFLAVTRLEADLAIGLGSRSVGNATATAHTDVAAIFVYFAADSVRVYSAGRMVLKVDPDVDHGSIHVGG